MADYMAFSSSIFAQNNHNDLYITTMGSLPLYPLVKRRKVSKDDAFWKVIAILKLFVMLLHFSSRDFIFCKDSLIGDNQNKPSCIVRVGWQIQVKTLVICRQQTNILAENHHHTECAFLTPKTWRFFLNTRLVLLIHQS